MTAIVFPQEAVVEYVKRLLVIVGDGTRDTSTLARQATKLIDGGTHGHVLATLRKYAEDRQQPEGDEIRQIVADMETFLDSKVVKHKKMISR